MKEVERKERVRGCLGWRRGHKEVAGWREQRRQSGREIVAEAWWGRRDEQKKV
ncbi:hypothetical protein OIU74_028885 [Salix koriyanagi]|uniref:Uncharacterized protein n=1 Tax=Salix koriyanagi TaxID=2511006 RepID=A0A9Q0ZTF3_9ROSI|nr:hypothetical protein OIU74_028885 [Salix koriyanagi]